MLYVILIFSVLTFFLLFLYYKKTKLLIKTPSTEWSLPLHHSQFIKVGRVNTHYIVKGEGNPLILIHGIAASIIAWRYNFDYLANYFRVYALDLKGFGYSSKFLDEDYSVFGYADFIKGFMDNLEIDRASMAGNSMGGAITLAMCSKYPQRVDKVILINSAGYLGKTWLSKIIRSRLFISSIKPLVGRKLSKIILNLLCYNKKIITEHIIEEYIKPYRQKNALKTFFLATKAVLDKSLFHQIKDIVHPCLIIWGNHDKVIPLKNAYRFKKELKNSQLEILDECGHLPQEECPEKVNQLISIFINKPFPNSGK